MRHLYLIGNGFDLAHKLETSYRQFLVWYLNEVWLDFLANPYSGAIKEDPLIIIKRTSQGFYQDGEMMRTDHSWEIKIPKDFETNLLVYQDVTNGIKYEIQDFLQKIFDLDEKQGWSDIEEIYWDLLTSNDVETAKSLNSQFDFLKVKLDEYILTIVNPSIKNKEKQSSISQIFESESNSENTNFLFLNLNYTDTITSIYGIVPRMNVSIVNLHGQAGNETNPINFGYSDDEDEKYQKLRKNRKIELLDHIKHNQYSLNSNYQKLTTFLNMIDKFKLHILGHSLGFSDRSLINTILEHSNCHQVELHYYRPNDKENNHDELKRKLSLHLSKLNERTLLGMLVPYSDSRPIN